MTWWAEVARRQWLGMAACLALAPACAMSATNAPAPAAGGALPAWLESDALATNAMEWADLAEIWQRNPDANASPVEHLTLPVEHYENGRIRAVLHAEKAFLGATGLIWAWQVQVEMLDPAGAPDGRVDAESCLYDRTAKRGYCPSSVQLVRTNATISGTGLYWTMTTRQMRILSNGVVTLRQGLQMPGTGPATRVSKRVNLSGGDTK